MIFFLCVQNLLNFFRIGSNCKHITQIQLFSLIIFYLYLTSVFSDIFQPVFLNFTRKILF